MNDLLSWSMRGFTRERSVEFTKSAHGLPLIIVRWRTTSKNFRSDEPDAYAKAIRDASVYVMALTGDAR